MCGNATTISGTPSPVFAVFLSDECFDSLLYFLFVCLLQVLHTSNEHRMDLLTGTYSAADKWKEKLVLEHAQMQLPVLVCALKPSCPS
jgi:hypothetical protein